MSVSNFQTMISYRKFDFAVKRKCRFSRKISSKYNGNTKTLDVSYGSVTKFLESENRIDFLE